eukprot:gene10477-11400_t
MMQEITSSNSENAKFVTDEDVKRDQAILDFQNRLVLLHHAANCPYSNRTDPKPCRGFPSCFEMVQLLKHVNNCELRDCSVPHCLSTRYLLTHSKTCEKEECIICRPLKESIKRKSERSRQVVVKRKREEDDMSPPSTPRPDSPFDEQGLDMMESIFTPEFELSMLQRHPPYSPRGMPLDHQTCTRVFPTRPINNSFQGVHCFHCLSQIWKGYRYYCPQCDVNMCMGCFHFSRGGDQLPHEHPVIPKRVYQINHSLLRPSLSSASLSSHTSTEQD